MMKVGLIGFGGMGRTHASLMSKHDDVKLLAVADVQANLRQWAERDLGVKTYEDGFEMIKAGGFDVIFVCGPTYLHAYDHQGARVRMPCVLRKTNVDQ